MSQSSIQNSKLVPSSKGHSCSPTKSDIIEWIIMLCKDVSPRLSIEQLGDGEIYCRIVNHYVPGTISANRLIHNPKNEYEFMINLKQLQTALLRLKMNINFDMSKVCKQKFIQNWTLITHLYRGFWANDIKKTQSTAIRPTQEDLSHLFRNPLIHTNKPNEQIEPKEQVLKIINKPFILENYHYPQDRIFFTIDKVKQILLSSTHDTEKMRQIRMLFGLNPDIKIQEDENKSSLLRF